jgi:hypothetical protein
MHVADLLTPEEKEQPGSELAAAQRPAGGWSLASLVDNHNDPGRQTEAARKARAQKGHGDEFLVYVGRDKVYRSSLECDGYATGLVVYVLRQAGVPANDARVQRGVAWLKAHQRESGRWFTPSQGWHTQHLTVQTAYSRRSHSSTTRTPSGQPLAACSFASGKWGGLRWF